MSGRVESCSTCFYSDPVVSDTGAFMVCHREPPQVVTWFGGVARSQPTVGDDDWCGEWCPTTVPEVEYTRWDRVQLAWRMVRA